MGLKTGLVFSKIWFTLVGVTYSLRGGFTSKLEDRERRFF